MDVSLDALDVATRTLGQQVRKFVRTTCGFYTTRELAREAEARIRRESKTTTADSGRKSKMLNLNRYTYHSLGDYVAMIRLYGTTDSYTTEIVCFFEPRLEL